jgi:preprotein translocase subunit SecB
MKPTINHPIQLETVRIIETTLRVFESNAINQDDGEEVPFKFSVSFTPFNDENKSIIVGITGTYGNDKQYINSESDAELDINTKNYPFFIRVRLAGVFTVDTNNFPMVEIENWAKMNPPIVLYPFLREHIYSLASRAGIREIILPMVTLPMYKIQAKQE